jgi:ATP/maltotriose-dependent transcriptional regulator MalT
MNEGHALAVIDTPALCVETVPIGRLLEQNPREILLVASSDVVDQRARVAAAKLGLPHQGFVLSRPRLHKLVEPVRAGGVVGLVAGPGCGKTAFVVDLLSSAEGRTVYFSLDEGDRDPLGFLSYLMAGLGMQGLRPAPEDPAVWSAGGAAEAAALDLTADLMDFISAEAGCATLLAIDDFHLVDSSPQVVDILSLIARGLPPRWTMLVSSRRPLPLDLETVGLGGRSVVLQARDLRLTPREVAAWAAQNWGLGLQPSEARSLWRLSEGWPAALVLLGQQLLSHGGATHADLLGFMSRGRDLRAYLERHILSGLDSLTADVMLTGALLPRVIFPRDQEYLPGGPDEAEKSLEQLVARGFLVTRSGRRSYTVHPLVRAYAERQAWGSDDGAAAISRAAAHLERTGEHHRAASLYLRAGRFDDAARPLRALALSSLNAVVDFAHDGWADLLPDDDDASAGAWLLVAKARMLQQQMRYGPASTLYERAARLLAAGGDNEGLLPVLLGSVFCLFNQGLWEEGLAVMKRCRTLAKLPQEKVEVFVVEGNILVSLCRWDEAVEDYERALALAPVSGKEALTRRIVLHRSRLFFTLGHYRLAGQWAEKAVGRGSGGRTPAQAMALNAVATVAALTGDYQTAGRFADECLALVRSRGYTFLEIPALLNQAAVAQGKWDYHNAVGLIREAQSLAEAAGDSEGSFRAEDMFGDLSRRNRNAQRALEHHRKALEIVDKSRLAASERVRALTGMGMDLVVLGRMGEAQTLLEETVRLSRRWSLKSALAPSLFYLGWLHGLAGREHDAARCLTEAMHIAEEHGHVHFFSQEAKIAVPILALCDRLGAGSFLREAIIPLLPARLVTLFEELAKGKTYPTDVPLGSPPRRGLAAELSAPNIGEQVDAATLEGIEALTDREREVLKMIALGMSNKQIGSKLYISEKTVKTHANHVFRKLGVASRLQATLAFQSYQRARRAGGAGRPKQR